MNDLSDMFMQDSELDVIVKLVKERKKELVEEKQAKLAKTRKKKMQIQEPVIAKSSVIPNTVGEHNKLNYYALALAILGTRKASVNNAGVYATRDINAKPIMNLKDGTTLTVLKNLGSWSVVEFVDKNKTYKAYIQSKNIADDDEISVDDALHMIGYERKNNTKAETEETASV